MNTPSEYTLYVSGDPGSAELVADVYAVGFPARVVDIRTGDSNARRRALLKSQFAAGVDVTTVPWLHGSRGPVGNYEAAVAEIQRGDWLPDGA